MEVFVKHKAQKLISRSDYLNNLECDDSTPYNNKYKARSLLEEVLQSDYLQNINNYPPHTHDYLHGLKAIIHLKLASNYTETEENSQADHHFTYSLTHFSNISSQVLPNYCHHLQHLYNQYGFLQLNRDYNEVGLGLLHKSQLLYNLSQNCLVQQGNFSADISSSLDYMTYIEGGVNHEESENSYTMTMFYLAQAFTKLGDKGQAALYCGWTMQRQLSTNTHNVKEWAVNALSLSEYYIQQAQLSQARYLLDAALSLLPSLNKNKYKLKASLHMLLARVYLQALKLAAGLKQEQQSNNNNNNNNNDNSQPFISSEELQVIQENSQKIIVQFDLGVDVQHVSIPMDLEQAKSSFRMGNTLYKKALEKFILDGYVTEHITIQREVSNMYQALSLLDNDLSRQFQMQDRRCQLLQPLVQALNPKAYMAFYQQLLNELIEIHSDMYDNRYRYYFIDKIKPFSYKKATQINSIVDQMIKYNKSLFQFQINDTDSKNKETYQSVINAQLNIAKGYTKYITDNKQQLRNNAIEQLHTYQWIDNYITNTIHKDTSDPTLQSSFQQQKNICHEMVQLLPAKISKLSAT